MPIALDPHQTFSVSLSMDAEKPEELRPRFAFRYLTGRQWIELSRLHDGDAKQPVDQALALLAGKLGEHLASWHGIDRPFEPDKLLDILHPKEIYELARLALSLSLPGEDDLKKSESPSPSRGDAPAPHAAPATA